MLSSQELNSYKCYGVLSRGIARIPHLDKLLKGEWTYLSPISQRQHSSKNKVDAVVGWGQKPTSHKARLYASQQKLPFIALEDGFLRSLGLGVEGEAPLSIIKDDLGIYYDATRASRLEEFIKNIDLNKDSALKLRAQKALDKILSYRLSKYNQSSGFDLGAKTKKRILVVDQTFNDASLLFGGVHEDTFGVMLRTALHENPEAEILIKTHPDVLSGKKKGNFNLNSLEKDSRSSRVRFLTQNIEPDSIFEQVDEVYVATSHLGFEALLRGLRVRCFAWPWYAGWGCTQDTAPSFGNLNERRGLQKTPLELFAAAYIKYSNYIVPETGEEGSVFDVIEYLHLNKRHRNFLKGELFCVDMSLWKRAIVFPFLKTPNNKIKFLSRKALLKKSNFESSEKVVVWGQKNENEISTHVERLGGKVFRMEDGFIRSVGLGAELRRPFSLVLDSKGIYYDPNSQSDIEHILQNYDFSNEELERSQTLINNLKTYRLSKYNVGHAIYSRPTGVSQKIILVAGQVEDDASIAKGSHTLKTNFDLIKKVREQNPEAYLIYKPHPDVVSRNRKGSELKRNDLNQWVEEIVYDKSVVDLIEAVDEVHSVTSLIGFEALLRNKIVHCYGAPFYAGWGLTVDHQVIAHRTRTRNLLELAAAALIVYPMYTLPDLKNVLVRPEVVLERLNKQKIFLTHASLANSSFLMRQYRKLRELVRTFQR